MNQKIIRSKGRREDMHKTRDLNLLQALNNYDEDAEQKKTGPDSRWTWAYLRGAVRRRIETMKRQHQATNLELDALKRLKDERKGTNSSSAGMKNDRILGANGKLTPVGAVADAESSAVTSKSAAKRARAGAKREEFKAEIAALKAQKLAHNKMATECGIHGLAGLVLSCLFL